MMMTYPFNFDNEELMTFRDNKNKCNLEQIEEKYIRYYPILPKKAEEAYRIAEGEGYTFCNPTRGAFRVYVIRLGE